MSNKLKVAFVGCSLTLGDGFAQQDRDQIWPSLVADQFMFAADNLAVSGASNSMIFMRAAQAIQSKNYDIVFAQWTALNRIWLSPGPNVWYFATGDGRDSFEYRDLTLSGREKSALTRTLLTLNHDYQMILDLVHQVRILEDLAQHHGVTLININGLVPWTADLVSTDTQRDQLSAYTRTVLDFDHRDDAEILDLLTQLRMTMRQLDTQSWVNVWHSFVSQAEDVGPLGHHPGPRSHSKLAQQVSDFLQQGRL